MTPLNIVMTLTFGRILPCSSVTALHSSHFQLIDRTHNRKPSTLAIAREGRVDPALQPLAYQY